VFGYLHNFVSSVLHLKTAVTKIYWCSSGFDFLFYFIYLGNWQNWLVNRDHSCLQKNAGDFAWHFVKFTVKFAGLPQQITVNSMVENQLCCSKMSNIFLFISINIMPHAFTQSAAAVTNNY